MSEIIKHKFGKLEYLEFQPNGFVKDGKYPTIIHFHGAGSRGNDVHILENQAILCHAKNANEFPFLIFAPQCSADCWFDLFEQLKAFVDMVKEVPYVNTDRLFLSGVSMGGYASWQMLMSKPEIFKKAVICCGGGMYWNAGRIKTPVWAFHGVVDETVFFEESKKMVDAVNKKGGSAKLTSYEGVGHNCWDKTYSNPEIYKWLLTE